MRFSGLAHLVAFCREETAVAIVAAGMLIFIGYCLYGVISILATVF